MKWIALDRNKTWELVQTPNKKALDVKWVCAKKKLEVILGGQGFPT